MAKLRRFCAPGTEASTRASLAAAHTPAAAAAAIEKVATRLRALAPMGGDVLECANLVEQAALDVLGDVKTTGSFLVNCFSRRLPSPEGDQGGGGGGVAQSSSAV
jgi:hypothetical protein